MRKAHAAFTGAIVLLALTLPALAKNAPSQRTDDAATSSTCSAYQQAPDGSWIQLPCKESGERDQSTPQRNSAASAKTRTR